MKLSIRCLIAFLSVSLLLGSCTKDNTSITNTLNVSQPTNSGCYSLIGTWVRQDDYGVVNGKGMVVVYNYATGEGVIQSVNDNPHCFKAGDVKWKNVDASNCMMDDMYKGDCTTFGYQRTPIIFTDYNTMYIDSVICYKRQQ
jgi:hypothetical protein